MQAPELPFSPAAERNGAPLLDRLRGLIAGETTVLEIASGSGQHAARFAAAQPGWRWLPSEAEAGALATIDARCTLLPNVAPAVQLNVLQAPWPVSSASVDAVFVANLLHISPWPCCAALMRGAAAALRAQGRLLIYGPFIVDGVETAPSNLAFDVDLKSRDARWGLRRLADVKAGAAAAGLHFEQCIAMPANNLLLVLRRAGTH